MSETSSTLSELLVPVRQQPRQPSAIHASIRRFGGYALLAATDAILLLAALGTFVAVAQVIPSSKPVLGIANRAAWPAGALAVVIVSFCLGLYDTDGRSAVERFRLRVWSALITPFMGTALLAMAEVGNARSLVAFTAAAALWLPLGLMAETLIVRWLVARSAWGLRALLIGDATSAVPVASFLKTHPELGLTPVGYCGQPELTQAKPGQHKADISDIGCLGSLAHARHMAGVADVAIVMLSPAVAALDLTSLPFRRVLVLPEANGLPSLWLRSRTLGDSPALEFSLPLQVTANLRAKRLLDILLAAPLLVMVAPVLAALAIAIKVVSPGPVFYVQRRVGWNGKPLFMLKLRSMHRDAERRLKDLLENDPAARAEWARSVKLSRDPRVLPVIGNFMRRTSLDELPQLWNVMCGDMSIVGPRPFPSYHLDMFDTEFQALRTTVKPGLTGLWQVSERSDADLRQQQMLDTFYIRNWSLLFDLYITFRTVPAVLIPRGAR